MGGTHSKPGSDDAEDDKKQSSEAPDTSSNDEASSSSSHSSIASSSGTTSRNKPKNKLTDLPKDVLDYGIIGEYLTVQEQQKLRGVNRFFKQTIDEDRSLNARLACYHVLTGQPEELLKLLAKDPDLFFHKYPEVTFKAAGQVFYNVSPADLVYFLCDDDMWNKVKVFAANLPEDKCTAFLETWQTQQQDMGTGGADLLYVTGDTLPEYVNCFKRADTVNVFGVNQALTRPLLKNPDGIVCRKSPDNQVYLYYANPKTQTLEPIDMLKDLSEDQQAAYDAFKLKMTQMEPNTVRRSSNAEHTLFKDIFRNRQTHQPIKLTRAGVHYKQDGIDYIDTHHDFNRLTNAYLKCIRLYQAAGAEQNSERMQALYDEGDRVWLAELGQLQKEVIWLLQRYCEKNRPFYPLPDRPDYFDEPKFLRCLVFYNWRTNCEELVFDAKSGSFHEDFGVDSNSGFSIYKAAGGGRGGVRGGVGPWWRGVMGDLIVANRLTVDASNVVERPIEQPAPGAGLTPGR